MEYMALWKSHGKREARKKLANYLANSGKELDTERSQKQSFLLSLSWKATLKNTWEFPLGTYEDLEIVQWYGGKQWVVFKDKLSRILLDLLKVGAWRSFPYHNFVFQVNSKLFVYGSGHQLLFGYTYS